MWWADEGFALLSDAEIWVFVYLGKSFQPGRKRSLFCMIKSEKFDTI